MSYQVGNKPVWIEIKRFGVTIRIKIISEPFLTTVDKLQGIDCEKSAVKTCKILRVSKTVFIFDNQYCIQWEWWIGFLET